MNEEIKGLSPALVWKYFGEVLEIPRPSKKEEKIKEYLKQFGARMNLETIEDEIGNIIIKKGAAPGNEGKKTVILQSHIDMVCEKNNDTEHDFEKDPIATFIKDGWVYAKGTTLGADNGIGIAAQLAILADNSIQHGPIECLFTIDEETGLTGAFGLSKDVLKGTILLNLDSEDEGQIFIGCAGGKDTLAYFDVEEEATENALISYNIKVKGLKGGHSGDDINKLLANANKLLVRIVWQAMMNFNAKVSEISGGNLRNAIAREATAVILVNKQDQVKVEELISTLTYSFQREYAVSEPDLDVVFEKVPTSPVCFTTCFAQRLIRSLYACPHGVIAMSQSIPGFVETSTNLASIKRKGEKIVISTSQRSSIESSKDDIANMVRAVFELAKTTVEHSDGYPGWTPNPSSEILKISTTAYKDLFKTEPEVLAIHAGLECGVIGEKYPDLDMISFGPTIKGAHSPAERMEITTVQKFWDLTLEILKRV